VTVPVHLVTEPELDEATEENFAAMMRKAGKITRKLKKKSPGVKDLMRELRTSITKYRRRVIKNLLRHEFEAALMRSVPDGMVTPFASMFARCAVDDVRFHRAKRGDSNIVRFLCSTVSAFHSLNKMVTSGFMAAVFADVINAETATQRTVHVYIRDEDFESILSVLSSAPGWLFDRQLLILKLKGISSITLKLS